MIRPAYYGFNTYTTSLVKSQYIHKYRTSPRKEKLDTMHWAGPGQNTVYHVIKLSSKPNVVDKGLN